MLYQHPCEELLVLGRIGPCAGWFNVLQTGMAAPSERSLWHTRSPSARRSSSSMRLAMPASTSRARRLCCVLSPVHDAQGLYSICPE